MAEEYRPIENFANYEVSNFGNVRNSKTGRVLVPGRNKVGYYIVNLSKDKKQVTNYVHTLVAKAFIPNPENKPCVDHINSVKTNNNVTNLRYATKRENSQNAVISRRNKSGCKGVGWNKKTKKWEAHIMINGSKVHLGLFNSLEDAKIARINKANQAFGEFVNDC